MENKVILLVFLALAVFLIVATILIEDKFINLVNMIIPDRSVVSIYVEKSSL